MTKMTFLVAALVAAAAYSEAASARSNAAPRHVQAVAASSAAPGGCVRAPAVGAFATAPWSSPPCMPGTSN
jgi:hypothetical protein